MIMLPLWTGQNRAASADVEAAQASLAGMDLLMALSETQSFWRQVTLYQDTVIPQAEQSYRAGIVGYSNGKVDFMAVLDGLTTLANARLDYYEARQLHQAGGQALQPVRPVHRVAICRYLRKRLVCSPAPCPA